MGAIGKTIINNFTNPTPDKKKLYKSPPNSLPLPLNEKIFAHTPCLTDFGGQFANRAGYANDYKTGRVSSPFCSPPRLSSGEHRHFRLCASALFRPRTPCGGPRRTRKPTFPAPPRPTKPGTANAIFVTALPNNGCLIEIGNHLQSIDFPIAAKEFLILLRRHLAATKGLVAVISNFLIS
jgi:hypothetical protein